MQYRRDIDGLRALAVVPVVLNHAGVPGFPGGFVGVDVFFVISGFLITAILAGEIQDGRFSLAGFYERRVRRILPALFAVLVACLVVGYFRLIPTHYEELGQSTLATLLFVSNIWFWVESLNYFGNTVALNPLLHTWSLSVEEQFYVVFPILLWALMRYTQRWTVVVIALLVALSFVLSWREAISDPEEAFFMTQYRVWELGLGALLALVPLRAPSSLATSAVGLLGLLAIAIAIAIYGNETPFPGLAAALPCLGAVALIWAGSAARPGPASQLLSLPPVVWIGLISYSLYLWHWPVMAYTRIQQSSPELEPLTATICIAVSVVLAALSWRFIERPFRRGGRIFTTRRRVFGSTGVAAAALFGAALVVDQSDGVEARLPDNVLAIRASDQKWETPVECRDSDFRKPDCVSSAGPLDILIWGDSHSGSIWTTVAAMAGNDGLVAATVSRPGCAPFLGVSRAMQGRARRQCSLHNHRVLKDVLEGDDIQTVVLFARWPLWAEGERPEGEAGRPFKLVDLEGEPTRVDADTQLGVFERGLERTVEALAASGREVLIVGGAPEIGWHVRHAREYAAFLNRALPDAPTLEDVRARHGRADRIIADIAQRHGATFLPFAETICAPVCPVEADGLGLYNDDDHFNRRGAERFVAPLLAPYFAKL